MKKLKIMSNFANLIILQKIVYNNVLYRNQGKQPKFYKSFILCGQMLFIEQCRIYLTWTAFLLHFINNVSIHAFNVNIGN